MKNIFFPLIISTTVVILTFVFFEEIEQYFQQFLHLRTEDQLTYSFFSFLILSSDILLPVPSSVVMYTNGLVLGVVYGTLLSFVSSLLSAGVGYYLGRFTNFNFKDHEKASRFIERYGTVSIVLSRGIPILSESISYVSGYNKLSFKNFILLNVIGYIPVCLVYGILGHLGSTQHMFVICFVGALVVTAICWFFGRSLINIGLNFKNLSTNK
jgi:uncharacterized membrane protein YdjX (TVP38/TMEM64 family)